MSGIKNWKEKLLSILEQVPVKADRVKPLIQFIVTAIAPSKIYIMGYPEMDIDDYDRYIDLLIVMPSNSNKSFI